mmetsp:Transcript_40753/g.127537  ORF Transcript_40753/g.127537 Transcript_40753/m.127537 type:complete len:165 (+) Transcript_40753:476-970(+)
MLAVSLVAAGGLLEAERRLDPSRFGRKFVWQAAAFMAVAAFQITLCFVVNCSGVSIIWNAVVAFNSITVPGDTPRHFLFMYLLAFAMALSLDVYYAFTLELLTTIAHLCSLLLGGLGGFMYLRAFPNYGRQLRRPLLGAWNGDGGGGADDDEDDGSTNSSTGSV